MRDGWFDEAGVDMLHPESARASATFQKYFADEYISSEEVTEQENVIRNILTVLEGKLDDSMHAEVGAALHQYDVLVEMYKVSLALLSKEAGEDAEPGATGD